MSEQEKVNQPKNDAVVEQAKETQTDNKPQPQFTQEQLDNIIKQRLEAEKSKYNRQLEEQKKAEEEAQKEKAIKEAKTKADLEKLMQERIASKDAELQKK
jgi:predicted FMN-binding regulatory protein PaiB